MSQTSFLEAVVSWDELQCKQNLDEALPKLISQLQQTDVLQEEIGILKIICQSFLPCLEVQEAEERLFSQITDKSCETWDKIMANLTELPKQLKLQQEISALLELLSETLDCFLLCVEFIQSSSSSLDISTAHSLPYGTVHLLKGAYSHCKNSAEIYGAVLASVTEPLSVLFKKAHMLQVAFISMMEKIEVTAASQQDAQDLCYVCQGLFEVCQVVTSLDVKLMCSIWKAISRFSTKHKTTVKDDLDIDGMVIYLCAEITSGYHYLFQLATPKLDSNEISLSQGDSAAFQKSVKVLGYQMRIMMSLIDSFVDYVSDCETHVVKLLLVLQRSLPPCLKVPEIASDHSDEIRRQLLNAPDTVISTIIVDLCSRSLPPCLKVPEIASDHSDEIRRQLLYATDTVISTLIVDLCSRSLPPCLRVPEIASDHSDEIRRQLLYATDTVISTLIVDLCSRSLLPCLKVTEIASDHSDEIRRQLLNATDTVISLSLPPCLKVPEIASDHTDEIRRQLLNATDTVISTLIGNRKFMEYLTLADNDLEDEFWLPYLLLLVKILDCLPKQKDDVVDKWVCPKLYEGDIPRVGLLTALFTAVEKCFVELSLSVSLPGVSCGGKPVRDVSLYEYVCTHLCAYVGSCMARHFHLVEEVLLDNLLSSLSYCSLLAVDTWCFLARFGTADLCFQQTCSLIDLWSDQCTPYGDNRILTLVGRLIKFLAPEHQVQLIKKYPPCDNVSLWCEMPLLSLPQHNASEVLGEICQKCVKNMHNFINKSEKVYKDLLDVAWCLTSLNRIYRNEELTTKLLTPALQQSLVERIRDLWAPLDLTESGPMLDTFLAELLELSAFVITELQTTDLLKIFQLICVRLNDCTDFMKLAITRFLQNCGRRKVPPSPEQPQIFSKIPQAYDKVLCDNNAVLHTKAVESFTQFAETTPHETLVPECIGNKPFLQDIVVAYLSKTPSICEGFSDERYIQYQKLQLVNISEEPPASDTTMSATVTSLAQPSTKRKRLQQDEAGDKVEDILTVLETSVQDLEQYSFNTSLPNTSRDRLATIVTRIQKILDENG